jgi:hypothetical protein
MDLKTYTGVGNKGVLFVDKAKGEVHIYDWDGRDYVFVRSDRVKDKKLEKAVEDPGRDVRAVR